MWTMTEYIFLVILIVMAVRDIKSRNVPVWILGVSMIIMICYVGYQIITGNINYCLTFAGGIVGVFFLIMSKITEEAVGYGDSFVVLFLGIILGFWNILFVLSSAFLLLLCVTIPLLWKKKMSRKVALPFLPFLAGGYLSFLIMGGMNGS